jgi:hypothetical protein
VNLFLKCQIAHNLDKYNSLVIHLLHTCWISDQQTIQHYITKRIASFRAF